MGILEANVPKSIGRSIYRNRLNRIKKIVYTHEQANWRTAQSQCLKRNWKLIEFRLNYTSREKKRKRKKINFAHPYISNCTRDENSSWVSLTNMGISLWTCSSSVCRDDEAHLWLCLESIYSFQLRQWRRIVNEFLLVSSFEVGSSLLNLFYFLRAVQRYLFAMKNYGNWRKKMLMNWCVLCHFVGALCPYRSASYLQ